MRTTIHRRANCNCQRFRRQVKQLGSARFTPASHLFKNIGEQNVLVSYIIALALLVLTIAAAVALLTAIEFHQYIVRAVRYPLYELITHDLLEALQILKSP